MEETEEIVYYGSNIGGDVSDPFYFDYYIEFDDDYDADDEAGLDALIASMPSDVDSNVLKPLIIQTGYNLSNILRIEPGIHHISQIIKYNQYVIKVELDNSIWEPPNEMNLAPVHVGNNIVKYYAQKNIINAKTIAGSKNI